MLLSPPVTPQGLQTLIASEDIHARIGSLATAISRDHPDGVHLVCVLKGAFMFAADLARCLTGRVTMDFIAVSSYGTGSSSSG